MRGHTVAWRPDGRTLEFSFHGIWGEAERAAWAAAAHEHLANAPAGFRFLVDFSDYPVQEPETEAFHSKMMTWALDIGLGAAVHVVPSAVVRQQMRRASDASPIADRFLYAASMAEGLTLLRTLDDPAGGGSAPAVASAGGTGPTVAAAPHQRAGRAGWRVWALPAVTSLTCIASAVVALGNGPASGAVAAAAALGSALVTAHVVQPPAGRGQQAVPATAARGMADDITAAAQSLARQAATLQERGQILADVSTEVDRASQEVARDAVSVGDRLRVIAANTVEMSGSISQINEQTTAARRLTTGAADKAEHTRDLVAALDQSSREIGNVVSLIRTIAEQTNMLALNATIEAARAGDAGRGFAVVATEVKGLSQATANATKQIEDKVGAIQRNVLETVAAIDHIATVVAEVSGAQSVVSGAVDGQLAVTAKIGLAVEGTTTDTTAMIDRVRQLALATREVSVSVGVAMEVADELRALDRRMQDLARSAG